MTHPPSPLHRDSQARHLVRPRWVWGGLLLALIGAGTLGLGLIVLSATVSVVGATVLLLGATASLRGGVLYDAVPNLAVRREFHQVREGDVHPGTAPGDTLPTTAARRDTAETNRSTRSREAAALHHGDVRWAPVAGWILLVVTIALTASQWELVAPTVTGRANSFRDTGLAILLGLTGLRTALAPGRHGIAATTAVLAGLGLVLGGLLAGHDHAGIAVVEVTSGCVAILCALSAYLSPTPSEPR